MEEIINKVDKSGIIQLDPQQIISKLEVQYFDISELFGDSPFLKEKEFRNNLKHLDYSIFHSDLAIGLYCANDVILPKWTFMLLIAEFRNNGFNAVELSPNDNLEKKWSRLREFYDYSQFHDERIIIKGCSSFNDSEILNDFAFQLTNKAKSIMFGEACSSVPINKKRKA